MEFHLSRWILCVLSLVLVLVLVPVLCRAAPGLPGTDREEVEDTHIPSSALSNPFGSGEEERRLLQSYIHSSLKDGEGPELSTWEQEVFFLFRLYDYDRSGLLDGLEMMKLLLDYNSHHTSGAQTSDLVVTMVDSLLHTQDLDQDGLLAPSELLSPSLPHTQDIDIPHQDQEVPPEEKLSNPVSEQQAEGTTGEADEPHEELHPPEEVKTEEQETSMHVDEQNGQQGLAAEQRHEQDVPVHQGQPEI